MARLIITSDLTVSDCADAILIGDFGIPTRLVADNNKTCLCLPPDPVSWGLGPGCTWKHLRLVVACLTHSDKPAGTKLQWAAWRAIPTAQWPALVGQVDRQLEQMGAELTTGALTITEAFRRMGGILRLIDAARQFQAVEQGKKSPDTDEWFKLVGAGQRGELGIRATGETSIAIGILASGLRPEHRALGYDDAIAELATAGLPCRSINLPAGTTLEQAVRRYPELQ
jgi:hypothetical protein